VSAICKLGQDARAETILARFADEGVSTRFALRDGRAPTGASVLISAHDRNAAVFTFRGANTLLETKDLKKDAFAVDLVYVSGLSNESAACFPQIVTQAKAEGALVATNPGIRQLSARQKSFRDVIGKIDILAVNRHEAEALVPWMIAQVGEGGEALTAAPSGEGLPDLARRGLVGGGFELSLKRFFKALHDLGPKWIVITDGKDGAFISAPSGIIHCAAPATAVAGTAGAGDAYNSTFAAYIAETVSAEEAALHAACNAASVITCIDTQTGLLPRDALERRVDDLRGKIRILHWKT